MFTKKFEIRLYVPVHWEVAGDMPGRWAENLKNSAEMMNERRQAKIPDDGTFISQVAIPANQGFSPFVQPGFISKSDRTAEGIKATHAKNITTSFDRWNDKINKSFETKDGVVAKDYKAKVDGSKDRWAQRVGDKVLRFTGDRIRGLGVAPITAYYLVGDTRASSWVQPSDFKDGEAYDIAQNRQRVALKAAVQQRLIQGGLMVVNQELQPSAILAENTVNAELLTGMRDPAKCDAFVAVPAADKCFCAWALDANQLLYLWVQVGITVP
jgi:hypothetical protein